MPRFSEPVTLRLEPRAIPAVRTAIDESLVELDDYLVRLGSNGYIRTPWLADSESERTMNHYNARVMDSPDGPYAALRAYEVELRGVRDTLAQIEDAYRRTEGDNVELWGGRDRPAALGGPDPSGDLRPRGDEGAAVPHVGVGGRGGPVGRGPGAHPAHRRADRAGDAALRRGLGGHGSGFGAICDDPAVGVGARLDR